MNLLLFTQNTNTGLLPLLNLQSSFFISSLFPILSLPTPKTLIPTHLHSPNSGNGGLLRLPRFILVFLSSFRSDNGWSLSSCIQICHLRWPQQVLVYVVGVRRHPMLVVWSFVPEPACCSTVSPRLPSSRLPSVGARFTHFSPSASSFL